MMKKILLIALAGFMAHAPVSATEKGFETGNGFMARNYREQLSYVLGVFDAVASLKDTSTLNNKVFCPPNNLGATQATDVAIKFIKKHPEHLQDAASGLIIGSFVIAFPCK